MFQWQSYDVGLVTRRWKSLRLSDTIRLIESKDLVTNLNADLLDGKHASEVGFVDHIAFITYVSMASTHETRFVSISYGSYSATESLTQVPVVAGKIVKIKVRVCLNSFDGTCVFSLRKNDADVADSSITFDAWETTTKTLSLSATVAENDLVNWKIVENATLGTLIAFLEYIQES